MSTAPVTGALEVSTQWRHGYLHPVKGDVASFWCWPNYEPGHTVLHDILYAKPGRMFLLAQQALVKQIITNLLNRFYDIVRRQDRNDGINITKI